MANSKIDNEINRFQKQKNKINTKITSLKEEEKEIDGKISYFQKLKKKQDEILKAQKKLDMEISGEIGGNSND